MTPIVAGVIWLLISMRHQCYNSSEEDQGLGWRCYGVRGLYKGTKVFRKLWHNVEEWWSSQRQFHWMDNYSPFDPVLALVGWQSGVYGAPVDTTGQDLEVADDGVVKPHLIAKTAYEFPATLLPHPAVPKRKGSSEVKVHVWEPTSLQRFLRSTKSHLWKMRFTSSEHSHVWRERNTLYLHLIEVLRSLLPSSSVICTSYEDIVGCLFGKCSINCPLWVSQSWSSDVWHTDLYF